MNRILAVALMFALVAGCASARPVRTVRLSDRISPEPVLAEDDQENRPLRIAVAAILSPQEMLRSYGLLFSYLGQQVGRPIEPIQRRTYQETYDLLRHGAIDLALVCTYVYVRGRSEIGLELLAGPEVNGKAQYQSLIIVQTGSGITSFDQTKGKRFAFTDPLSNSGHMYPLSLVRLAGESPGTYFASTAYTYSHDNSIKAVAEGVVDAAAVDSLVFDQWVRFNPSQGAKLEVVHRSEPFPSPPVVASQKLDPALRDMIRQALLTMHENEEGRAILAQLGMERFVLQTDAEYASVRAVAEKAGFSP